jgi:hypothetical protein
MLARGVMSASAGPVTSRGALGVVLVGGRIRQRIRDDPGLGTGASRSWFAVLMADVARQALA